MTKENKIHDQWLFEKSDQLLESLSELVDTIDNHRHHLPEEFLTEAESKIHYVLGRATVILATAGAGNSVYSIDDKDLVFTNGVLGYMALKSKYKFGQSQYISDENIIWNELERLLKDGYTSVGEIHSLLRRCALRNQDIEDIKGFTESRIMGEISWEEYSGRVLAILETKEQATN